MSVSIVIPYRKEALLEKTIASALRASPDAEIIAIEDKHVRGVGQLRNEGIHRATNETVVLIDAHMTFERRCFSVLEDYLQSHEQSVCCVNCRGLDVRTMLPKGNHRYGAQLIESRKHKVERRQLFVSSWHYGDGTRRDPHKVSEVLGGCYGLRKSWYIDGLGSPWQYHEGWGKSEQIISLSNYLFGGDNVCLPKTWAAHLFRPGVMSRIAQLERNLMLLMYGWIDAKNRKRIMDLKYPKDRTAKHGAERLYDQGIIQAVAKHLRAHKKRTYNNFKKEWLVVEEPEVETE